MHATFFAIDSKEIRIVPRIMENPVFATKFVNFIYFGHKFDFIVRILSFDTELIQFLNGI